MSSKVTSLADLINELTGGDEMMADITRRIADEARTSRTVDFTDVDNEINGDVNKLNNLQAERLRELGYEVVGNRHTLIWTVSGW